MKYGMTCCRITRCDHTRRVVLVQEYWHSTSYVNAVSPLVYLYAYVAYLVVRFAD